MFWLIRIMDMIKDVKLTTDVMNDIIGDIWLADSWKFLNGLLRVMII